MESSASGAALGQQGMEVDGTQQVATPAVEANAAIGDSQGISAAGTTVNSSAEAVAGSTAPGIASTAPPSTAAAPAGATETAAATPASSEAAPAAQTTTPAATPQQTAASSIKKEAANKKKRDKRKDMPIRQYLDSTVVPVLLAGMSQLTKERPDGDEVEWLAHWMLRNNPNKKPKQGEEE